MMKKAFRIFAAFTMLAVYLAMTVNVAFAALMCRCPHHAAVHHAHCTHCADSGHAGCACPIDGFAFTDACNCNHDHSTSSTLLSSRARRTTTMPHATRFNR